MRIRSSEDIKNDRVGSLIESKSIFVDITDGFKDEFYSDDILGQTIEDETFNIDDIIDFRLYKKALLKALDMVYKYFKTTYPESIKYLEIFILINSIELPEEYSYLLEEKYNKSENYEQTFAFYGNLFNVSRQAVFERINKTFSLLSKLAKAFYNSSKNNVIKNLDNILSKFNIKNYSKLIDRLSEDEIVVLMSDYMLYYTGTNYDYDKMCNIFNYSILEKYFSVLNERKLFNYLVNVDFEDYPKLPEEICLLRIIFNKPIFQEVYRSLTSREQSMIYNAFNRKFKIGSTTVDYVMKFLEKYNKRILKYMPKPKKKKNNLIPKIEETTVVDEDTDTIYEEIQRIRENAKKIKGEHTISERQQEEKTIEEMNDNLFESKGNELNDLKSTIEIYFVTKRYSEIVKLLEGINKNLFTRYLYDLDEGSLFKLNLAYLKGTEFLSFNFTSREKIILLEISKQPKFNYVYSLLLDNDRDILRYLYRGEYNEYIKRNKKNRCLDKYIQAFVNFWNIYNAYFNDEYKRKHNM